jgi:hypothetical protein
LLRREGVTGVSFQGENGTLCIKLSFKRRETLLCSILFTPDGLVDSYRLIFEKEDPIFIIEENYIITGVN